MSSWVELIRNDLPADRYRLGSKAASLATMAALDLPTPPAFTITTHVCRAYLRTGQIPDSVWADVCASLTTLERQLDRGFGDPDRPLLVSVRSGAAISMPGMMDTVLNVGLNRQTLRGLAASTNQRFARDCYRRLLQMFATVVLGHNQVPFTAALEGIKQQSGADSDAALGPANLDRLIDRYEALLAGQSQSLPDDPFTQLQQTITAVFASWRSPRARAYRQAHGICDDLGTAATVQAMVFGNLSEDSATGVAFSRDPNTGYPGLFGEFLVNAQGEDVVAGIRTPQPLIAMTDDPIWRPIYDELREYSARLEHHFGDLQDVEFTVEAGKLWLLQARSGQRTAPAAVAVAVDLADEGVIDRDTAISRIKPEQLVQLLHPRVDERQSATVLATGLPASPGGATGRIVFDPVEAKTRGEQGEAVILVRQETAAGDFPGMAQSAGLLTAQGGMTSHAAVVARGMGKPAITGCHALQINELGGTARLGERQLAAGDEITIDGTTGQIFAGRVATIAPAPDAKLTTLLGWADEIRRLGIRANADSPEEAWQARTAGAEGIGLCRTEHMFRQDDRIDLVRQMILAPTPAARALALTQLEPLQTSDFAGIFRVMDGLPVTIRTLDPPLHEFLPSAPDDIARLAKQLNLDPSELATAIAAWRETNPMLGYRGCRLGITLPEITEMQTRAICRAALACAAKGIDVRPEIMVPLVTDPAELADQRQVIIRTAEAVFAEAGRRIDIRIGTMIELPRAALLAEQLAVHADFLSFGTNDLTQTTLGLSRDDAGRFLPYYTEHGLLPADPFQVLDEAGVGELIAAGMVRGRRANPVLKVGICGEHGGDPQSIAFCHRLGLDYVSCSPLRLPVARLAAAQAALHDYAADT